MTDQPPNPPDDRAALAARCDSRANGLATEAELLAIELAGLESQKDARWATWEANKSDDSMWAWRMFHDRLSSVRGNLRMTNEDVEHYRACSVALTDAMLIERNRK